MIFCIAFDIFYCGFLISCLILMTWLLSPYVLSELGSLDAYSSLISGRFKISHPRPVTFPRFVMINLRLMFNATLVASAAFSVSGRLVVNVMTRSSHDLEPSCKKIIPYIFENHSNTSTLGSLFYQKTVLR